MGSWKVVLGLNRIKHSSVVSHSPGEGMQTTVKLVTVDCGQLSSALPGDELKTSMSWALERKLGRTVQMGELNSLSLLP